MANTTKFEELEKRLSELCKHMLPAKFSPTGTYSERLQDRARGYRLLVHAEIEAYIEDMAITVITDRIRKWKHSRTPSNLLLAFLACFHSGWIEYDERHNLRIIELAKSRKKIKNTVNEIIDMAQTQFVNQLKDNHGVRENNLKILIPPTGIELNDLDQTWIADIDDFGKVRGEIAHKAKSTTGSINPQDEYNKVTNLLRGIKDLDEKLNNII